jgi:FtsH-binding integral membrane protein
MNNNQFDNYEVIDSYGETVKTDVSAFMSKVFTYMFVALMISGVVAYVVGTSESLLSMLITEVNGYPSRTILGWIVMLSPLGLVILMSARLQKMSAANLLLTFFVFATLFGASISYIFVTFSMGHITQTFFISGATFGVMALVGYYTSTDLSKMGSILYMALIGLIIAMVVNWFLQSPMMAYVISGIGVLIFTGLTAYDTQKLKNIATQVGNQGEMAQKMIIMGALTLYLDFVNLFLLMLQFFGGRD